MTPQHAVASGATYYSAFLFLNLQRVNLCMPFVDQFLAIMARIGNRGKKLSPRLLSLSPRLSSCIQIARMTAVVLSDLPSTTQTQRH
jgi:hypothetical protein